MRWEGHDLLLALLALGFLGSPRRLLGGLDQAERPRHVLTLLLGALVCAEPVLADLQELHNTLLVGGEASDLAHDLPHELDTTSKFPLATDWLLCKCPLLGDEALVKARRKTG